jgi:hypothetical protein
VLDELMSVNRTPCRERGGGGGGFGVDWASLLLGTGLGMVASVECCDDIVKDELLRDLLPAVEFRNWLCLRARGKGGGTLFCGGGTSGVGIDSLDLCCSGAGRCWETSCELMCMGGAEMTGVGGSGLFTSELSRGWVTGEGAGSDAAKLSNDTVCGCLGMTSFP